MNFYKTQAHKKKKKREKKENPTPEANLGSKARCGSPFSLLFVLIVSLFLPPGLLAGWLSSSRMALGGGSSSSDDGGGGGVQGGTGLDFLQAISPVH